MDARTEETVLGATEGADAPESPAGWGTLLGGLMTDLATLLRQELHLARVELAEKAGGAKGGLLKAALALGIGVVGLGTLAAALVCGLMLILSLWLPPLASAFIAALVVGAGLGAGSYFLFQKGVTEAKAGGFLPERTLSSLKENAQWASHQFR